MALLPHEPSSDPHAPTQPLAAALGSSGAPSPRWLAWIGRGANGVGRWRNLGLAVLSVVVCTLVDLGLKGRIDPANLIMVYLLGVLPVALLGSRGSAIATAGLAVAAFDWFFIEPYFSLAVSDTQYLFTLFVMGLVGVVISSLTARLALELTAARERERLARTLYALGYALLAVREPEQVLAVGARVIGRELGMPVGAWTRDAGGQMAAVAGPGRALDASERAMVAWVLDTGRAAGADLAFQAGGGFFAIPVGSSGRVRAALGIDSPAGHPPSAEVRAALETGANQLATAFEAAEASKEVERARRQADEERLRNALLSTVSHDLRTPLTGIVGAASSLIDSEAALAPGVRGELLQGIVDEAERLNRLVTNLLSATRLDAPGGGQLVRSWAAIEEIIGSALARLDRVLASHPVRVEVPAELPLVYVDAVLVEQVFANLLENAAKYTPAGTPVRLRAWREGPHLVVEVRDSGPGLPQGEETRVFERFRRYPNDSGAPGTGLGLAICRGVVEAHGGTIAVASGPEGGTRFRFTLPTAPTQPLPPVRSRPAP